MCAACVSVPLLWIPNPNSQVSHTVQTSTEICERVRVILWKCLTVLPAGAYLWFGCSLWANCVLEQFSSTLAVPKQEQIWALKAPHAREGRRKVWTRHAATVSRPRWQWVRWHVEQAALAIGSAAALNVGQKPKRWPSVSHVCSASSGIRLVYFFSCVCLCFAQGAAFAEFCIAS